MTRRHRRIKTTSGLMVLAMLAACEAQAGDWLLEEFTAPYRQRVDAVTPSAGNAKEVNSATHIIDPWPRGVGNRRIPANGDRMSRAMERYRDTRKLREVPPPVSYTAPSSGASSTSSSP